MDFFFFFPGGRVSYKDTMKEQERTETETACERREETVCEYCVYFKMKMDMFVFIFDLKKRISFIIIIIRASKV